MKAESGPLTAVNDRQLSTQTRPQSASHRVAAPIPNYHLTKSTLMLLVSAFAGYEPVMALYRHAIAQGYRFFSYGDAMLLQRRPGGNPA